MVLDGRYDNFFCITDVFDDVEETVYKDICHLNALGDSLIAERILGDLPLKGPDVTSDTCTDESQPAN